MDQIPLANASTKLTARGSAPTAATLTTLWRPSTSAEKADGPDPAREREHEAHREGQRADGGHAHDHVAALDQRRSRDHGNGEEKAELRGRGGAETAPQRGAHSRAGARDAPKH